MTAEERELLILGIILIVGAIVATILVIINSKITNKILSNSEKLKMLLKLNKETGFHKVKSELKLHKHYDNKSSYLKIQPEYLMAANVRENIDKYILYCDKIRENRDKLENYQNCVDKIHKETFQVDYKVLGIPKAIYKIYY